MKLRAQVTQPAAAEEIRRFLELQGYGIIVEKEDGLYKVFSYIPEAKPSKRPMTKTTEKIAKPEPLLRPIERRLLYWIVCTILIFLILRFL